MQGHGTARVGRSDAVPQIALHTARRGQIRPIGRLATGVSGSGVTIQGALRAGRPAHTAEP